MTRRLTLLIGSFLILAMGVLVYSLLQEGGAGGLFESVGRDRAPRAPISTGPASKSGLGPGKGIGLNIQDRPEGRLRAWYRAKSWTKRDDGSYMLDKPVIVMYQNDGRRAYIRGDYAEVFAEEVASGVNVRRGLLAGEVKIFFDRDPLRGIDESDPQTPFEVLEAHPENAVRIYAEDLSFNNDQLEIETNSRVSVMADEADIYGRGISIRWNEQPRTLREMVIRQGQYMAIYNMTGKDSPFQMPTTQGAASQPNSTTQMRALAAASQPVAAGQPAGASSQPAAATSQIASSAASTSAPASTSAASEPWTVALLRRPTSRSAEQVDNIFVAEFTGSQERIQVNSGQYQLAGASTMSLMFEWAGKMKQPGVDPSGRKINPLARRPLPQAHMALAPTPRLSGLFLSGALAPTVAFGNAAVSRPASAPANRASRGKADFDTVEITWSGPLTIRPVGYTETPSQRNVLFTAEGKDVVLSDARTWAICRKVIYTLPAQRGWLIGKDGSNVRMSMETGQEVACRWLEFRRNEGLALLQGPGYMLHTAAKTDKTAASGPATAAATIAATAPVEETRIRWDDMVNIEFGEKKALSKDGQARSRQFIKNAQFNGNVLLSQAIKGDFVRCRQLRVNFDEAADKPFPKEAIAEGQVAVKSGTSEVTASRAAVTFVEKIKTDAQTPAPAASSDQDPLSMGGVSIEPETITAEGMVRMSDTRNNELISGAGEFLQANVRDKTLFMRGDSNNYATLARQSDYLAGDEIYLEDATESAVVKGRGELRFNSKKDMSGGDLKEPRVLRIEWDRGMDFSGKRNQAIFEGNVKLNSGGDSMLCRKMMVDFAEDPKAKEKAATRPAKKTQDPRMAMSLANFSARRLTKVTSEGDVAVASTRFDAQGHLTFRMNMTSQKLIYDAVASQIDVPTAGALVAEDYRSPTIRSKADDGNGMQQPWQTLMEWKGQMQFMQLDRRVLMKKDVTMVSRSGKEVRFAKELNVSLENAPQGLLRRLSCQDLTVAFGAPKPDPADAKKPVKTDSPDVLNQGTRMGPLELFVAVQDVNLEDGPMQIQGQRVFYDNKPGSREGTAVVWGSITDAKGKVVPGALNGPGGPAVAPPTGWTPDRNAKVTYQGQTWTSPFITVYLKGTEVTRVITKDISSSR
ncbi:MAG: hypothetical protein LLG01_12390 [Planctomycetaceae bacterium]|nr:hypothetical protein [Planctomycetaceae bacterium]